MSRNGTGTYLLPSGNPVTNGTTIDESWANPTMSDIAAALTGSLPRDGQAPMTGQLKIADGNAAAPGIAFNSEASTGFFRPSSNVLAFAAGGTEQGRFMNSRLLLGYTSDNGERLQVNGTTRLNGSVAVTAGDLTVSAGTFSVVRPTSGTVASFGSTVADAVNGIAIYNDAKTYTVGVDGTTNDAFYVYDITRSAVVLSASGSTGAVTIGNGLTITTGGLIVSAGGVGVTGTVTATAFSGGGSALTSLNADNLASGTVPTARVSGAYSGITGVGTLASLAVTGATTVGGNTVLHAGNYNSYSPTLTGTGASGSWGISVTGSAGSVAWTNVSGRPTAVSSFSNDAGYLTAASLAPLNSQIVGNVSSSFDHDGTSSLEARNNGSGAATMTFHRVGAYGLKIGLDTDNAFKIGGWTAGNGTINLTVDGSGNTTARGNLTAYSDRRLKRDITRIDGALDKLLTLSGVTYTRVDTGERGTGLVAQEVETVFPEAVQTHTDELQTKSVAYGNLLGAVVEALRELKDEVETLKDQFAKGGE